MAMPIKANLNTKDLGKIKVYNPPKLNENGEVQNKQNFQHLSYAENVSKKVKIGSFLTTLAGVAVALGFILKKDGHTINPTKMFKDGFKKSGLYNLEYKDESKILKLAAGSIIGGLVGGELFDKKEHRSAKWRESVIQFVGNIAIPVFAVGRGSATYNKHKDAILNALKVKNIESKALRESASCAPGFAIAAACLAGGILVGNKVGNFINEQVFHVKDNRKIKASDFSAHVDDVCLGVSLIAPASGIGAVINKFIPAALMVAGVSTGVAQERPDRLKKSGFEHATTTKA